MSAKVNTFENRAGLLNLLGESLQTTKEKRAAEKKFLNWIVQYSCGCVYKIHPKNIELINWVKKNGTERVHKCPACSGEKFKPNQFVKKLS